MKKLVALAGALALLTCFAWAQSSSGKKEAAAKHAGCSMAKDHAANCPSGGDHDSCPMGKDHAAKCPSGGDKDSCPMAAAKKDSAGGQTNAAAGMCGGCPQ